MAEIGLPEVALQRFVDVPNRGFVRQQSAALREPPIDVPVEYQPLFTAMRQGDLSKADRLIQQLSDENKTDAQIIGARVFLLMLAGDINRAHTIIGALSTEVRETQSVRAARAALHLVTGDSENAAHLLEKVLDSEPRHELGRYLNALWRAQNNDLQNAHDMLVGLCRDYPDHALARLQLGQVLMAAGDIARAGTLFEAAIDTAPMLAQAWERFASLLVMGGQAQESLMVAKRGLSWHPGSRPLLEVLARSALVLGATDLALDCTRLVLATALEDPTAYANHAVALTASGRRKDAIEIARSASQKFPDDEALRQLISEIEVAKAK